MTQRTLAGKTSATYGIRTLLCLIGGGEEVKLHFLKFFTPKSILLWPTQIKEFSRKSYPPFNYHSLILWNFLVKLSCAKWKSWVRTKWENCSEHKQSWSYYLYKQNKFQQGRRIGSINFTFGILFTFERFFL